MTAIAGKSGLEARRGLSLATAAMGTWFQVRIADGGPKSRAAAEAAIEVIEDTHRRFSRFESSSLVQHLRRVAPRAVPVDRDTFDLFRDALAVKEESGGAFDIESPSGAQSGTVLDRENLTVRLGSGIGLDFGGIAKGHAIDLARRVLLEAGVIQAFIHGGTSSGFGIGVPPEGPWRIALGPEAAAPAIELVDQAFSVSSTGHRRHIADPRTGRPVRGGRRAAVVGPGARLADAWSTALIVGCKGTRGPGSPWTVWLHEGRGGWRRTSEIQ